jgi:hypothetical protein
MTKVHWLYDWTFGIAGMTKTELRVIKSIDMNTMLVALIEVKLSSSNVPPVVEQNNVCRDEKSQAV